MVPVKKELETEASVDEWSIVGPGLPLAAFHVLGCFGDYDHCWDRFINAWGLDKKYWMKKGFRRRKVEITIRVV